MKDYNSILERIYYLKEDDSEFWDNDKINTKKDVFDDTFDETPTGRYNGSKKIDIWNIKYNDYKDINGLGKVMALRQIYLKYLMISKLYNHINVANKDTELLYKSMKLLLFIIDNLVKYKEHLLEIVNTFRKILYVLVKRIYMFNNNQKKIGDENGKELSQ